MCGARKGITHTNGDSDGMCKPALTVYQRAKDRPRINTTTDPPPPPNPQFLDMRRGHPVREREGHPVQGLDARLAGADPELLLGGGANPYPAAPTQYFNNIFWKTLWN